MKMPGNIIIFLVGMPGVGKTYWGNKIYEGYDLEFKDLDVYVARKESASIAALFATYGESGFRERERRCLEQIIKETTEPTVIACGGGTPAYSDNMKIMKDAGTVVYLRADIGTLVQQLSESTEVRPLLRGRGDMATYLEGLLSKRKINYEQAHHILDTKFISLATFGEIIL